jgi:hypothetical protein
MKKTLKLIGTLSRWLCAITFTVIIALTLTAQAAITALQEEEAVITIMAEAAIPQAKPSYQDFR